MAGEPTKKVLVIEDEPSIRNNIMLMLKSSVTPRPERKTAASAWSWLAAIRPISSSAT